MMLSERTALTRAFSGRLARGIRNRFMDELAAPRTPFAPYPVQGWLTAHLKSAALEANRPDLIALWCGQSGPLVRHRRARDLAASLIEETSHQIERFTR